MYIKEAFKVADFEDRSTVSLNGDRIAIYDNDELDISLADDLSDGPSLDYIHAYSALYYKGRNLIGMPIDAFRAHVAAEPVGPVEDVWLDDEDCQHVCEFESLGAQVWVKDGNVISICVGPIEDDADD